LKVLFYISSSFLFIILFCSCNLFSSRSPEAPDTGKSNYQLPTTASIVISNFKNTIIEKNVNNYILCFADTSQGDKRAYTFFASSQANAIYSSVFQNWNINSERQYFNTLINNTPQDNVPTIIFSNSRFDVLAPDSAVYTTDYYLYINHTKSSTNKYFAGTLQLSLSQRPSGLWSIYQWIDSSPSGVDTVKSTWSMLKAQFS
jgi:hypothetical protein